MTISVYRNKFNGNKFVEVKRTKCRHFYIRQYMFWEQNGVLNYTGYANGSFHKTTRKRHLDELLKDYEKVGER